MSEAATSSREGRTKRRRPFGVTVIALLQAISAPTAGVSVILSATPAGDRLEASRISNIIAAEVSIIGLVIAVGLWRLHRWAWAATMIWFGANMAGGLIAWRQGDHHYSLLLLGIVTVFYLNQRDVQRAFRRRTDDGAPP